MPNINGISVDFPHDPYKEQLTFMERIITAIENKLNCVLESPTGTGKTMSLLCSTLACIQAQKLKMIDFRRQSDEILNFENDFDRPWMSKIIFSSRTHSQLKQAMNELRSTNYKQMGSSILGSRSHMCINSEVRATNGDIHSVCKSTVKRKRCSFFRKCDELKSDTHFMSEIMGNVLDIEDMVSLGKEKQFCPYYMTQYMAEEAAIVFSPYNYILDERIRCANEKLTAILTNSIIIFDEAHNIPQICEDSASSKFDTDEISAALADVECVADLLRRAEPLSDVGFGESQLTDLKGYIQRFQAAIDEIIISNSLCGVEFKGDFIFTLMKKSSIAFHEARKICVLIDTIFDFLADIHQLYRCGSGLRKFKDILWLPFSENGDGFRTDVATHFRVYADLKKDGQDKVIVPHVKIVCFWCFSAKFVMEKLVNQMRTRSMTFTSGTMSPLESFIESLCIPIDIKLQNGHIIHESQVLVEIVSNGSDGESLDSSFWNRSTTEYINSLGRTILSLCPVIPDGLLVFFTSYKVLDVCRESWKASDIWSQIQNQKSIFVEPRTKQEFLTTMGDYYSSLNDPRKKGAILIGVCRGKVAEGIDFADKNGRAVIVAGIPFPPWKEPKVQIKMKYLDDLVGNTNGKDWYRLEASRAVNQVVGRIIRHKKDFGAILLLDGRFHRMEQKNAFSGWIRQHFSVSSSHNYFGRSISSVSEFFKRHQTGTNSEWKADKSSNAKN